MGEEVWRSTEVSQSCSAAKAVLWWRLWWSFIWGEQVEEKACWAPGAGQEVVQVPDSWGNASAVSLCKHLAWFTSLVKPALDTGPVTRAPLWRMQVWGFLSCFVALYCIKLRNYGRVDICMSGTWITAVVLSFGLCCEYGLFSNILQGKMQSCVTFPCQSKPGADIASPILFSSMAVEQC